MSLFLNMDAPRGHMSHAPPKKKLLIHTY